MQENKKYEISGFANPLDNTLHRIRAIKNIPELAVRKGDLGGYVQSESNLSQKGNCWIFDDAIVRDSAKVKDNAIVEDRAIVQGKAVIGDWAKISNNSLIGKHSRIFGGTRVSGTSVVSGSRTVVEGHSIIDNSTVTCRCRINNYGIYSCVLKNEIFLDNQNPESFKSLSDVKLSGKKKVIVKNCQQLLF